ncbi:hypothetical protein CAPTEDRAFT_19870 [Capitella teleta]|uniref:CDK5 regulatory subunit-associated protein 3 n=1 Tax=Capitella teleta TaxID=283909 RepID=R7TW69_CAPTE|nr:hypothetical protein CAPTEDRAFT_19870 [Capitella teleta]|eukprot:ELT98163.1 hypothetical protein CAPTEDRAFT_19870 [Capitella teleta]
MEREELPIDIHYNKLLDWLTSRRHCQQQWQGAAITIREKINMAIQDMPPVEEITKLLHGTYINYFHCLKIVELLKGTDDGAKNIFGGYSSKRMKDWQEIIKLYEKDGVFLAEAAQLLMRNVNYEIPVLKKEITKCQQIQSESLRKEADYASHVSMLRLKYKTSCEQMGIEGNKVRKELLELVKDMPKTYTSIARDAQKLQCARDFYVAFTAFTLGNSDFECCPLLRHLMEKGNTTVYEWRKGEAPNEIEATPFELSVRCAEEEEKEEQQEEVEEEIDWGMGDNTGDADVIDFDISVEDGGNEVSHNQKKEGVARGEDALTILDNQSTRDSFMDDLMELEAFLSQRLHEMTVSSHVLMSSQFQNAPECIQLSSSQIETMLTNVNQIINIMSTKKMQDLFFIRTSISYVDRLADSLKKIMTDAERAESLSRLMVAKRQEALQEEAGVEPKLDLIRKRTKELQKQIESEISDKYKGRRVNVMGEINTV